jgi:hypothetical protein
MSNTKQIVEPTFEKALVDIQTLAQFALQSGDKAIMTRDLRDDPDNRGNGAAQKREITSRA